VRALLGQQISVAAARTLAGRLVARCGTPLGAAARGPITHVFPTAAQVAAADLDAMGLTGARVQSLRGLARAVADGTVELSAADGLDAFVKRLSALPGIGAWSAQYIAMRALGEPDAFPAGDLGVRKALARGRRLPTEREVIARAERWRPWRAYAVLALWTGEAAATKRHPTTGRTTTRRTPPSPRAARGATRTRRSSR
jgi:AraC family transcriptional regulator of adaptative response / DNA-3-methyladenine glycosylase II